MLKLLLRMFIFSTVSIQKLLSSKRHQCPNSKLKNCTSSYRLRAGVIFAHERLKSKFPYVKDYYFMRGEVYLKTMFPRINSIDRMATQNLT